MDGAEARGAAVSSGGAWQRLKRYFRVTIWAPPPPGLDPARLLARRLARLAYLVGHGFLDDKCLLRAEALTFMSILVLVPLLALVFSLSKGLGLQNAMRQEIVERLAVGQQEIAQRIIDYVDRTDVTALGAFGLLILVFTAVSVLGSIEKSFNDIWGVAGNRTWPRKFSDYLSVLIIFPILLIASTGITASLSSSRLVAHFLAYPVVSLTVRALVRCLPIVTVCAALTFIYIFMPNTRVRFRAGLAGGVVAGVVWHLAQWAYIHFQVGVARYNAIYGTFASLPIFLVWLDVSWIIVLLGGEIAYSIQHEGAYHPPVPAGFLTIARQERAVLLFLTRVWKRFVEGGEPLLAGDLAAGIDLPRPASHDIVEGLIRSGLLVRTAAPRDALLPTRDFDRMTVGEMLLVYRHQGEAGQVAPARDSEAERVEAVHRRLEAALATEGSLKFAEALEAKPR